MADFGSADRQTKRKVLRTLDTIGQGSVGELQSLMESTGHFDSTIGVSMACSELVDEGKIQEVAKDGSETTVYQLIDDQ